MNPTVITRPGPADEELPEEHRRVLLVAAHPDDPEFSSGGTVALWVRAGIEVVYVLATSGDKGTPDRSVTNDALSRRREEEQRGAAARLGVNTVEFLRFPDGELTPGLELRGAVARMLRKYRPYAVMTHDPLTLFYNNEFINHPDHRAVGQASLDVVLTAGTTPGHFPELLEQGLEPWRGLRELYMMGPGNRPVPVDISSTIDRKIQALLCHRSQVGDDAERISGWLRRRAADLGGEHGLDYAEVFQVIVQGPGFHPDEWTDELGFEVLVPVEHDPRAAPARRGSGRAE
jgi:LmbE family N-acetylglucosaminyl deacetylase